MYLVSRISDVHVPTVPYTSRMGALGAIALSQMTRLDCAVSHTGVAGANQTDRSSTDAGSFEVKPLSIVRLPDRGTHLFGTRRRMLHQVLNVSGSYLYS